MHRDMMPNMMPDMMAPSQPPADAIMDIRAVAEIMNVPIFEDAQDIPKIASGMLDVEGRVPYGESQGAGMGMGMGAGMEMEMGMEGMKGTEPPEDDDEALRQAILDTAVQERKGSLDAQNKARLLNEQEEKMRGGM